VIKYTTMTSLFYI